MKLPSILFVVCICSCTLPVDAQSGDGYNSGSSESSKAVAVVAKNFQNSATSSLWAKQQALEVRQQQLQQQAIQQQRMRMQEVRQQINPSMATQTSAGTKKKKGAKPAAQKVKQIPAARKGKSGSKQKNNAAGAAKSKTSATK